ncbi:hypothetical protein LY78DRAFT_593099, partial [Colletotrichum sublineola]
IKDQYLSLQWVQEKIATFAGIADKVSVWDESAEIRSIEMQRISCDCRRDYVFRGVIILHNDSSVARFVNAGLWQP